jgi:uncharacterized protein YqeY
MTGATPAEIIKARLRADLRSAMQARVSADVAVLRVLIATLDNAEAVAIGDRHQRYVQLEFGDRSAEAPRRRLSPADIEGLLAREVRERRDAAAELGEIGQAERAAGLEAEAELIARYQAAGS